MCCGLWGKIYKGWNTCTFLIFIGITLESLVYSVVTTIQYYIAPSSSLPSEVPPLIASIVARCFYSQLLSLTSYLLYAFVLIRWLQVVRYANLETDTCRQNMIALIVGLLASTGVNILGNFTYAEVPAMYLVGSFLGFGLGSVYQLIMYRISRSIRRFIPIPTWLFAVKLILSIISFVMFISMYSFSGATLFFFGGLDYLKWKDTETGEELLIISITTQWICTISSNLYLLSMVADFRHFKAKPPHIYREELV